MTLTVLTIGQAPRPDLLAEIAAAVPGLAVDLHGALDGLARGEIALLAPRDDADTLFTGLPSGEGITVSKAAVTQRLRARLAATPGAVLLACTGAFKDLPARPDLVQPSAVLSALAAALLPQGRLGLVVPLAEQIPTLAKARQRPGLGVFPVAHRPFTDPAAAVAALAAQRPDLILLDCISYTRADKAAFAALGCPVLLAIAVAARATACLLPE
jgi:protein AroM